MEYPPDPSVVDAEPYAEQEDALLALGRWFMARAELSLRVASHPEELSEVLRLRRRHVERAGWQPGELSTLTEERDERDDTAVHLSAWDGHVLAGTARIILPTPLTLLPIEAAFGLRIEPTGEVVECGRWVVTDRYRDRAHRVSMGLSGLACLEVVSRGYAVWAGMTTLPIIELWRGLGFEMETLTPPRAVLGAGRVAVRCDLRASLPGLIRVLGPLGAPVPA
jgi:hypothetical protein